MVKPLEYYKTQAALVSQKLVNASCLMNDENWLYQELLYRISVMETLAMFFKAAPLTTDLKIVGEHFLQVRAYLSYLANERQYEESPDEKVQRSRDAAHNSLIRCFRGTLVEWQGFRPGTENEYRKKITKLINVVAIAWIQYRDTYLKIKPDKEEL